MKTIIQIIIKEFLQFRRDPKMFRVVLIAPVIQVIFLGYAATFDVNNLNLAVLDLDNSIESRKLIESYQSSGYFDIKLYAGNYKEITEKIDKGDILTGLIIPKDFEKEIANGKTADVQLILDGSDGNKASIAFGYSQSITSNFSRSILLDKIERSGREFKNASITPETRVWYNPELKTRNFMVPSITALILMLVTSLLTSLAIVKEKEIGTLEQLIVTPIKPYQLIIGKLIPFVILGFISVLLVNSVMIFWFGIPVRGSFSFLLLSSFIFILSTLGLGLFVSTISKTQQQAMMITNFAVIMPMIYLSGFAFPIENMPKLIQFSTNFIPLKYFINIIRGVVLKGIGFAELWVDFSILLLMGIVILFISSIRFSKRLE